MFGLFPNCYADLVSSLLPQETCSCVCIKVEIRTEIVLKVEEEGVHAELNLLCENPPQAWL